MQEEKPLEEALSAVSPQSAGGDARKTDFSFFAPAFIIGEKERCSMINSTLCYLERGEEYTL